MAVSSCRDFLFASAFPSAMGQKNWCLLVCHVLSCDFIMFLGCCVLISHEHCSHQRLTDLLTFTELCIMSHHCQAVLWFWSNIFLSAFLDQHYQTLSYLQCIKVWDLSASFCDSMLAFAWSHGVLSTTLCWTSSLELMRSTAQLIWPMLLTFELCVMFNCDDNLFQVLLSNTPSRHGKTVSKPFLTICILVTLCSNHCWWCPFSLPLATVLAMFWKLVLSLQYIDRLGCSSLGFPCVLTCAYWCSARPRKHISKLTSYHFHLQCDYWEW